MVGGRRIELLTSSVSRKRSPTELTARGAWGAERHGAEYSSRKRPRQRPFSEGRTGSLPSHAAFERAAVLRANEPGAQGCHIRRIGAQPAGSQLTTAHGAGCDRRLG